MPWSWADGVALALWFPLAQIITAIPFAVAGVDVREGLWPYAVLLVAEVVVIAGVYGWLRLRDRLSWRLYGPVRPERRHALTGLGVGVSGWIVTTLLLLIAVVASGERQLPTQETLQGITEGGVGAIVLGTVAAVVLAPVAEELIYRGVLFQALRARQGVFPAMGISSLLFGAMHFEFVLTAAGQFEVAGLVPMAVIAIFGFWLAGAFHRTGTLVVPIVAHMVFNAIALGLALSGVG